MEMTSPPADAAPAADSGISVARECLAPGDYIALYRAVGEAVQWDQRLRLDQIELQRLLVDPGSHVHVLRRHGEAVGLCEFCGVGQSDVELVNFGLVPNAQGTGLGRFLLNHALRECWSFAPRRIWLHTDTNDHPRAVQVYEKAGFRPYLRQMEIFPD